MDEEVNMDEEVLRDTGWCQEEGETEREDRNPDDAG